MLAKYLKIFFVCSLCIVFTGCELVARALYTPSKGTPYARDQAGRLIPDCEIGGHFDIYSLPSRLKENNLPKNTLNIVCENGRTVLPKDCEGNRMNRKQIERYWKKYDLWVGVTKFQCKDGIPIGPKN